MRVTTKEGVIMTVGLVFLDSEALAVGEAVRFFLRHGGPSEVERFGSELESILERMGA